MLLMNPVVSSDYDAESQYHYVILTVFRFKHFTKTHPVWPFLVNAVIRETYRGYRRYRLFRPHCRHHPRQRYAQPLCHAFGLLPTFPLTIHRRVAQTCPTSTAPGPTRSLLPTYRMVFSPTRRQPRSPHFFPQSLSLQSM